MLSDFPLFLKHPLLLNLSCICVKKYTFDFHNFNFPVKMAITNILHFALCVWWHSTAYRSKIEILNLQYFSHRLYFFLFLRVSVNNTIVISQGLITLLVFMLTLHDLNKLSKEIQQNPDYLTELLKMNKNIYQHHSGV